MKICGLQKTTLLDYPDKVACTVFTGGCNFRCPFCHNASLVISDSFDEQMSLDEFYSFLDKRKGILDGVCLTGGEPLLQKGLIDFIKEIKKRGYLVKLDTNGSSPDKLKKLVSEKLVDYVAMDIKSSKEHYGKVVGLKDYDIKEIEESVQFLLEKHVDFEFRTTAVKGLHVVDDFKDISEWIRGTEHYFIQNFVDSGDLIGQNMAPFSKDEMHEILKIVRQNVPSAQLRGVE